MMDPVIVQYTELVSMIGKQFGESCQACLYTVGDAPDGGYTGVLIAVSGAITNDIASDTLPPFIQSYIAENGFRDQYGFINKFSASLTLRSSIQFLRRTDISPLQKPETDTPVACFCIHHNIVHLKMVTSFLEELSRSGSLEDENDVAIEPANGERPDAVSDIRSFLDNIVTQFMVERLGANKFVSLDKQDKLALISELDKRGVFLVKGAVNLVAKHVNVSKFSIYNYLDEIRRD